MRASRPDQPPNVTSRPPAAASRDLAERLRAVESRDVTWTGDDFPVFWERARGCNVWDADGNRYVDLTAGFAVAAVGHAHPRVVDAVRRQAGRLLHGMGDVHPPRIKVELLERLAELAPYGEARTVLGTSGTDAVEAALKTAALATGRPGVLAFTGAYHGLGYGALAVTDRERFRRPFAEQLNPHVRRAGFPHPYRPPRRTGFPEPPADAAAVRDAALADVARILAEGTSAGPGEGGPAAAPVGAVVVEPIQGRGGEVVPPAGFLAGLSELCREHGALLVADEVYTGFGRTGHRFACDREEVVPDLLCVGKGFSGGMPISACVGARDVMDAWPPSDGEATHTHTFLGHPLSCAAALAALEVIEEEGLADRAGAVGSAWREELGAVAAGHPGVVGDVRGRGLMIGLDLVEEGDPRRPAGELARRVVVGMLRRGWLVLAGGPEGNVLSLSPPLTVPPELLARASEALDACLREATEGGGGREP